MTPASAVAAMAAVLLASVPSHAAAHAFAQRYDLPLPLWHYLAGAGAAVALSFAAVSAAGRARPGRARVAIRRVGDSPARLLAQGIRGAGVLAFMLLLAAGAFGRRGDWDSNLLPVAVWIWWWVGLSFLCLVAGDLWRLLDPWRTLAQMARITALRPDLAPAARNCWPAVALFFAFSWAELVWPGNADPRRLAMLILAYTGLAWIGMGLIGPGRWRRCCDPFARFFAMLGDCAPLAMRRVRGGWVLVLRWPGAGLALRRPPSVSQAAFVILALATVGFDGIAETAAWEATIGQAFAVLYASGFVHAFGYGIAGTLVKTAGLVLAPFALFAAFALACAATGRIGDEPTGSVARRFVLSLVPIAAGYHLAHYLAYLLIQGQAGLPLLADPLALGWNLFGLRGHEIDIGIVDMRSVWVTAVLAIVGGHAIGVALADASARRAYGARATLSQLPMAVLMVGYTMLSLWILSQPIVNV
jgi:hypothetical protein